MRLIDADDLHVDYLFPSTTTMTKCYEYVSKAQINNAHTIEAVPVVHGRWVKQNPLVDTEECSHCGYNIVSTELETPFCPWCGASMKMEGNDES